jgi:hypothetical protein
MAREESNREDLLREATALVERIELVPKAAESTLSTIAAGDEPIVAGFRADGALSIFFGADAVYQFNAAGELRRAYRDGLLFKAVNCRLVSLRRERNEHEVQLVRHELSDAEQEEFVSAMSRWLRELSTLIHSNPLQVTGQVPEDVDLLTKVCAKLDEHKAWRIAARPNA